MGRCAFLVAMKRTAPQRLADPRFEALDPVGLALGKRLRRVQSVPRVIARDSGPLFWENLLELYGNGHNCTVYLQDTPDSLPGRCRTDIGD